MPRVSFLPSGAAALVSAGTTLLDAAIEAGVTRVHCCGMAPPCGRCRVTVIEGDDALTTPGAQESALLLERHFLPGQRFGCLASVYGNVEIEVHE